MPGSKVKPEFTYEFFHGNDALGAISKKLGVHYQTLLRWWAKRFGEEAVTARAIRIEALAIKPEDTYEAFYTEEAFKSVSSRIGVSPNLLRSWWIAKFGKEAVNNRGKTIQAKIASETGRIRKGTTHDIQEINEKCETCGSEVVINLVQKSRLKRILCGSCEEKLRGVDRHCPVCGFGCVGEKGLAGHMARPRCGDPEAHLAYLGKKYDPWENKEEGRDFVKCRLCDHCGIRIDKHLSVTHALSTDRYKTLFPDAKDPRNCSSFEDIAFLKGLLLLMYLRKN